MERRQVGLGPSDACTAAVSASNNASRHVGRNRPARKEDSHEVEGRQVGLSRSVADGWRIA